MVVVQEKRVKARNKTHQRVKGALFDLVVVTVKCITRSESDSSYVHCSCYILSYNNSINFVMFDFV